MMRTAIAGALGVLVLACGRSEAKKLDQVRACSAITTDADGAATCLVQQYRWKQAEALVYARRFEHERDSIAQLHADSAWRLDAARHAREVAECAADPSGDMTTCLMGFGWAEPRAQASEDSAWHANSSTHRDQVARCSVRRDMQAGACLQLYYKWSPARALAVDDSIRRAALR